MRFDLRPAVVTASPGGIPRITLPDVTALITSCNDALEFARSGDTLIVWKLDRLARSMKGSATPTGRRCPITVKVARASIIRCRRYTSKPMLIDYARVSTADQNLALRRDALTEASGPDPVSVTMRSGNTTRSSVS